MFSGMTRRRLRHQFWRLLRPVRMGVLGGTTPLSTQWGQDRGHPIDRYYIEQFVERYAADIRGRVLEIKDPRYTERFGHGVTQCDVLDLSARNSKATIVADLATADAIPADTFDCCIVTQTLQYVYDVGAAIRHLRRILKPGGVLLVTVPGFTRMTNPDVNYGDYWRFTPASCARLFDTEFAPADTTVA